MLDITTALSNTATEITVTDAITTMVVSFVLGVIISLTYIITAEKENYSQSFCYTLVIVPVVAAIIILLVGSSIASALSVSGAFALVRFRSEPGSPKNIAYIFATVAVGLACGLRCYLYGAIFAIFLCVVLFVFTKFNFGFRNIRNRKLKILIPESLDFENVFEDILNKYTVKYELIKVATADLGSIYELDYNIVIKGNIVVKDFIDELRCRNGNLTVAMYMDNHRE